MKWTVDKIMKQANKCANRHEFKYRYQSAYNQALKLGMMEDLFGPKKNISRKGKRGGKYWTLERLKKTASRYKTRHAFRLHQPGAYMAAYMYNQLEEICSHMPKRTPWVKKRPNEALIFKAASESNTLISFKMKYCGAYINAHRYGLIAKILEEMKIRRKAQEESDDVG